jgi:type I restriction enzyme S subunit
MREGWKEVALGDVCEFNLKNLTKDFPHTKICYLDITSVGTGEAKFDNIIDFITAPSRAKRIPKKGDTLIATVRPGNRSFYYLKEMPCNTVVSTGFAVLSAMERDLDNRFLYYIISNEHFTQYLVSVEQGANYPAVSANDISKAKIQLPPLHTQRKIASILSAYDDLIENNLKRIKLLEEKAQRTYEEWFVKMRFPGYETAKIDEVTGLPEGWDKVKLGNTSIQMIDGDRGKNYPKQDEFTKEGYCLFLNTGNVTNNGFQFQNIQFITQNKDEQLRKGKIKVNDIILTTRGTIGNVALYNSLIEYENVRINSGMLILRCVESDINYHYFHQLLISNHFQGLLKTYSYGAAQPQLPIGTIIHLHITKPSINIQNEFSDYMKINIGVAYRLKKQNRLLKEARDILLPRLMSGMLDVEE